MKFAYLRVSTLDKQEFVRQEFALKDYGIDKFFEEKISGTKKASNRPIFESMLNEVKSGDTIYFESMSRMARSMQDLIDTTNMLANKMKVKIVFVKENITVGGTGMDAMTGLIFNIMGAFAQFERDLISDRTKQSLQAKKENGMVLGRPKIIDDERRGKIRELKDFGWTPQEIAEELEISVPSVYRLLKEGKKC